jgi:hypothetical protein
MEGLHVVGGVMPVKMIRINYVLNLYVMHVCVLKCIMYSVEIIYLILLIMYVSSDIVITLYCWLNFINVLI